MATDHTSFEAHIVRSISRTVELQVYKWMCQNLEPKYYLNLKKFLDRNHYCRQTDYDYVANARMSGGMQTSLGNGLTNLMIMEYFRIKKGWTELAGVVEGDDGLFRISGPKISTLDFMELGFTIKAEEFTRVGDAGFCQLYNDGETMSNLFDASHYLLGLSWTQSAAMKGNGKTLLKLAKSKAYSLLAEGPSNPITRNMALWILRETLKIPFPKITVTDNPWLVKFNHVRWDELMSRTCEPTISQRLFYQDKFGISVAHQLRIEKYFDEKRGISPIEEAMILNEVITPARSYAWDKLVMSDSGINKK